MFPVAPSCSEAEFKLVADALPEGLRPYLCVHRFGDKDVEVITVDEWYQFTGCEAILMFTIRDSENPDTHGWETCPRGTMLWVKNGKLEPSSLKLLGEYAYHWEQEQCPSTCS